MLTILLEVSPIDLTSGDRVTLHLSGANSDYTVTDLNGYQWVPCVYGSPTYSVQVFDNGLVTDTSTTWADLSFFINNVFGNTAWLNYRWGGATARIWFGTVGEPFESYVKYFEGTTSDLKFTDGQASVSLYGPDQTLTNPLLSTFYTGTGGLNGISAIEGKQKPCAWGECSNVEPIQIDTTFEVYQVHDGAIHAVTNVYEGALDIGTSVGDFPDYGTLTGATLDKDQWASCNALGLFRLGGKPSKTITADVQGALYNGTYYTQVSDILPAMLKSKGILSTAIDQAAFDAFSGYTWDYYGTDDTSIGDVVRGALSSFGGYLLTASDGSFTCGNWFASSTPTALYEDRSQLPLVGVGTDSGGGTGITLEQPTPPCYRLKLGSNRCWRVMTKDEISSALIDMADDIAAAEQTASDAADAAALAQAQSAQNSTDIANMVSDNVLDRSDKSRVIQMVTDIINEKTGLDSQAQGYGITTEKTAYDNAYTALITTYLPSLTSPVLWSNLSDVTTIVGTTFRQKFNDYANAKQTLLNKIQAALGLTGYLTAPALSLTANSTGTVTSYVGATGKLVMRYGNADVTEGSTFTATSTGTGLTYTLSNTSGSKGQYTITGGWTENTPATLTITGSYTYNGTTQTVVQTVSITKSLAGAAGSPGAAGSNNQQVFIYQRASSTPTLPSASTTYNFTTGAIGTLTNGWTALVPSGTDPIYMAVATASSTTTTATIPSTAWAAPVILAMNGKDGTAGFNTATVTLYQRASAASTPSVSGLAVTYTFGAANPVSGTLGSWSTSVPASNGVPCWSTQATASSSGSSDSIASTEWSTPIILVQDGAQITLTASAGSFYFVDGVATSPTASITFTATELNASETISFTSTPSVTLSGSGMTRTLSVTDFGTNTSVVVTATGVNSGAKASATVTRVNETSTTDSILTDSNFGGMVHCVTTDTLLPTHGTAGEIKVGDELIIGNPVNRQMRMGRVSVAQPVKADCVRITTKSGIQLDCSTSAPIAVESGECVVSANLMGHRVPVVDAGEHRVEDVVSVEPLGEREVMQITCENDLFLAGAQRGRYLFHHNIKAFWVGDGSFDNLL